MDPNPYPLVFEPRVKARVWGGTRLQEDFGRPQMEGDTPCGESWEMADLPGDSSVVTRGELEGVTLSTLVQEHPKWLMGEAPLLEGRFPLLLKLLDAEKTLSVQVHPDEEAAKRLDGRPKTEAWIILETQPGACLYLGLKEGVTPRELREACKGESLEGVVHRVEVEPMDVVFIPAGTVHAIGAGLAGISWTTQGVKAPRRQGRRSKVISTIPSDERRSRRGWIGGLSHRVIPARDLTADSSVSSAETQVPRCGHLRQKVRSQHLQGRDFHRQQKATAQRYRGALRTHPSRLHKVDPRGGEGHLGQRV